MNLLPLAGLELPAHLPGLGSQGAREFSHQVTVSISGRVAPEDVFAGVGIGRVRADIWARVSSTPAARVAAELGRARVIGVRGPVTRIALG